MSAVFIDNGIVITMDAERRVLDPGAVLIEGTRIVAVGDPAAVAARAGDAVRVDANRMAVMPGLIDSHGHAGHAMVKSLGAGDPGAWVQACLQIYACGSNADFWRAEARLAALERLKAGVTTSVSLMGGGTDLIRNDAPEYPLAYADAVGECGTRAYLAMGPNRPPFPHRFVHAESGEQRVVSLAQQMEVVRDTIVAAHGSTIERTTAEGSTAEGLHEGRVRFCLTAPVFGPDRLGDGLDEAQVRSLHEGVMRLREELGVLYTQDGHCAGTLAFARDMGAIGPWSLMSHSIDLTEDDMSAAREADAVIVHNPSAIMSIRGRCPVPELLNMGVRVVLGSDGAAPDRGYDMFRHMAQCMHYHRRHFRDAKVLPAGKVLEMATIDAAAGLGRSEELGSLEPGKRADVILVDLFKPHLVPINMAPMRIAHFANAADVDTVIVDGEILMQNRKVRLVDEAAVLEDAQVQMERIIRDNDMAGLLQMPGDFWGASGLPASV